MTLREAIEQLVDLGEKDPREIAAKLRHRHGDDWLAAELFAAADDLVAEVARHVLGANRRSSLSLARVAELPKREVMLQAAFLPGVGWVKFGDFAAEDFDRLASTYRKGASALARYAEWCESAAARMREQGASRFRELKGGLPELGAGEAAA